jgi:putative oxidoreductase
MKTIFSVGNHSRPIDIALLIARIGIAGLMLTHGLPKLFMLFSEEPVKFPAVLGMSAEFSLVLTVFAEVLCSVFLLIGFATRLSIIPLAVTMMVAAFLIHASDPLAVKESALHYLLVYLFLFLSGSGKYSVDYLLQKRGTAALYPLRIKKQP